MARSFKKGGIPLSFLATRTYDAALEAVKRRLGNEWCFLHVGKIELGLLTQIGQETRIDAMIVREVEDGVYVDNMKIYIIVTFDKVVLPGSAHWRYWIVSIRGGADSYSYDWAPQNIRDITFSL